MLLVLTYLYRLLVLLVAASLTLADSGGSASGDINGLNSPPVIEGCPANATEQVQTQQSISNMELTLPALNLSMSDPDGDNVTITVNTTSSMPLSFVNIANPDPTTAVLSFPGSELGTFASELVIEVLIVVTDPFGEETTCVLTYLISITQAAVCSLIGDTPVISEQVSLALTSVDITVQINIAQATTQVEITIQTTVANILNDVCSNNCPLCEMTQDCQQFLILCQPFPPNNVEVLNSEAATSNRKRQTTATTFTIAVRNPTVNSIIANRIFPSGILAEVLDNNRAQFTSGTGLTILSITDNNPQIGIINFELIALIVLPVVVGVLVLTLIVGVIIIVIIACVYKSKKKANRVEPVKQEPNLRSVQDS